jgi:23S rRNA-/tRNA-specific pseudouridylate synthase
MAKSGGFALLDIVLSTGRKHQIRAQLAAHGWPIRFDQRYHPAPARGRSRCGRIPLSFDHPTKAERMHFFANPGARRSRRLTRRSRPCRADVCDAVYADENILVVAKRAGVEVTTADGGENSLEALLAPHFGKNSTPYTGWTRTPRDYCCSRATPVQEGELLEAVKSQRVEKYYQCLLRGMPRKRGRHP